MPSDGPGLVSALNTGLRIASGTFIARMDADDISMPGRLARQREYFESHPGSIAVGGQLRLIDSAGRAFGVRNYPTNPRRILRMLRHRSVLAHPATMIRAGALRDVGGYREPFVAAEDYDLWLRLSELGSIGNVADVVLLYRVHPGQVTRTATLTVAESTYLAQRSARLRRRGHDDLQLPWRSTDAPALTRGFAGLVRWRIRVAASLYVTLSNSISRKHWIRSGAQLIGWVLLRPRYALAVSSLAASWVRNRAP